MRRIRMRGMPRPAERVDAVVPLTSADLAVLRPESHPRLRQGDAEAFLASAPGLSRWHPASREFVLVGQWRHRQDIAGVEVLSAFYHEDELIAAAVEAARDAGKAAFVVMDAMESRNPAFYERNHLERIESILTFEHEHPRDLFRDDVEDRLIWAPVSADVPDMLDALLLMDHQSFPWFWQNSPEEFRSYMSMPFVEVWGAAFGDDLVGYIGVTHFRGWSHLDRIAIMPEFQGQGFGREALRAAVRMMVEHGAGRVGLSTQSTNMVSQALYRSVGFIETPPLNYDVYGVLFEEGRSHMEETT